MLDIIDTNLVFEGKGVCQGSILAFLLLNMYIYRNGLSEFVVRLSDEKYVLFSQSDVNTYKAQRNCKRTRGEFSNNIYTAH
jgi:hypothetical protein